MGFNIFDLRQVSLDQMVAYSEQRQPVLPSEAELHSLLCFLCILSAQRSPPFKLIQPLGGVLFCYRAKKEDLPPF